MNLAKLNKLIAKGRVKAIVKDVGGRRMLFGFERLNRRSRKYHIKDLSQPIDLVALTKAAQAKCNPEIQVSNATNIPTTP